MAHPWDMMAMSPCPPRLRWSPGVCEWSSRALRSILAHAATAPMSARAGRLPSPWVEKQKAHEKARPPHAAPECDSARCRCVEAGRITYLLQVLCLPCLFLSLFRTLLLRGTVVIGHRLAPLSVCLLVCLSGLLPFSCVPRLPSQLCVLCCPAARARTPVWHLPAELGVVAGGARRPTAWQASSLPLLSSRTVVYFRSCCSKLCFSPNAGQTMRPRSLPVLEPDIGLNLPQATHFPPTHILFRIFWSLFSAGLAICSSALAL